MRKAVATDMAALNKHGYEVVSNCLPENRSIRFTLLMLRQAKRTSENACPFCLMHYVRGIRTRALRKRHSASFLAAARRLLQSIKTADQGCFAKDKNESLFLRHKNPTYFVGFFVASEE